MSVLINFKICSNDSPCNVPPVCPTGAVWWDAADRTLKIDNSKCVSCGACARACPIAAIRVAKTKAEYDRIKAELDADPRRVEDLKVDRYGAGAFSDPTLQPQEAEEFVAEHSRGGVVCLELQMPYEDMPCHLLSIPMAELLDLGKITYRAVAHDKELAAKYDVADTPALAFFKDGAQIGRIEGYYEDNPNEKSYLISQIKKILG